MADQHDEAITNQLLDRRERLVSAMGRGAENTRLGDLLREVDTALERLERGTYGLCEGCHDPIERDRLSANPLLRYCLDHLSPNEQRALEEDLHLAFHIQNELLPQRQLRVGGWEVSYHYEPLGPVSGDYCDLMETKNQTLLFALGDASGKGVAASMLMSQLHAIFRTLITLDLPMDQMVGRANRIFCEAMIPGHFATLVCGRADRTGSLELVNAGHCPPLALRAGEASAIDTTGLPLGLFRNSEYGVTRVQLAPHESLLLYTDGVSEARNTSKGEYGSARLARLASKRHALSPPTLVGACLEDLATFRSNAPRTDDLTLMVIQRVA